MSDVENGDAFPDFVVVSIQRSGSTMLTRLLDSHPDLTCFGEIFVRRKLQMGKLWRSVPKELKPRWEEFEARKSRPRGFIKDVGRHQNGRWGFKIMVNQSFRARELLIRSPKTRLIVLRRENELAVHASGLLAKAGSPTHVPFDRKEFLTGLERRRKKFATLDEMMREAGCVNLRLRYEDLRGEHAADVQMQLARFLDVAPIELTTPTQQRNSDDVLSRFSNPDDAAACLREIGHPEWAHQSPSQIRR